LRTVNGSDHLPVSQSREMRHTAPPVTQAAPLSGRHHLREEVSAVSTSSQPEVSEPDGGLVNLHEKLAGLLASRGQWREAYDHLRSALDLLYRHGTEPPAVPEQLRREVDRLRREHAKAHEQSIRDSLTASYNRRYLDQRLVALVSEQGGTPSGLAVALVDLDWFKQVNDRYGHLVGDRVLQQVVELLQAELPETAFCARYGGEEFVLVLPDMDPTTAVAVSEAARSRVELHDWSAMVPGLRVTVSVGVAHEVDHNSDNGAEHQLLQADSLLYSAKQSGRNAVAYREAGRVHLAGPAAARRAIADVRVAENY
jgi:diguanylate cyclase (GGDEF)-like protein